MQNNNTKDNKINNNKEMGFGGNPLKLFVPGRLCLFGEHSDWAGMHRVMNSSLEPGYAIVSGIEQGIYATAVKDKDFIVESSIGINDGESLHSVMDTEKLLSIAKEGGFFSYVAGVASYISDNYSVGGLRITITGMDLPIKSGLSSSAAICVLVARAFNQLYDLKMNIRGEMLAAFLGEQRTPSRCGRLDQACAYGVKPVYMKFDGTETNARPLRIGKPMYWVVADLQASKNTIHILSDLNKCYPFAESEKEMLVHEALGSDNDEIVAKAAALLEAGDAEGLGKLMEEAQENFDKKVAPASPVQLAAPVLHSVLNDPAVKKLVYGGKGVGSQGDGTVQFLAKDLECRDALIDYLEKEKKMPAFSLTLQPGRTVKRAIIPVAGFGTRLYPATKGIKKDFLPILDSDGILKPALLILLEQLEEAGIEQICLVIGAEEQEAYDAFFSPLPEENIKNLPDSRREIEGTIARLRKMITYVYQNERLGFGHAVYQCRAFAGDEPVILMLGDMLYESNIKANCTKQLIQAYEQCGRAMVTIQKIPLDDVIHYGIVHGHWEDEAESLMKVEKIHEKPDRDYAKEYLGTAARRKNKLYYAVFGQYILTEEIFTELGENIANNKKSHGEFQLTDALDAVREKFGMYGFVPEGKSYDIGLPEAYRETMIKYGR